MVKNRDGTFGKFGENLGAVQQQLSDWGGDAGDAFHQEMHHQRRNLDDKGNLAPQLASAISRAETDASACRAELQSIDDAAAKYGWNVSDGWIIDYSGNPNDDDHALKPLEDRLAALKVKATNADDELANAMRTAVGDAPLDTPKPRDAPKTDGKTTPANQLPLPTPGGDKPFPTEATKDNNSPDPSHHLSDNPNASPLLAGLSAAEWRERLKNYQPGQPLPDPRTPTGDPAIDALANAAGQQNTTYAWGGNKNKNGPSVGQDDNGDGAHQNHDWDRHGYDCGGLVRYAVQQGAGFDVGMGTGAIDADKNRHFTHSPGVPNSLVAQQAKPGDVLVFPSGTGHTGIYIGNGFMLNAPDSGNPVRVDTIKGHGVTDILEFK